MRPPAPRLVRAALLAVCAMLCPASCRVGPDYRPPDLSERTQAAWRAPLDPALQDERAALACWWERFGCDELNELARRLVAQNLSLAEARQRVVAARVQRAIAGAGRAPDVRAEAAYARTGTGDESLNFQGPPPGEDVSIYSAGVSAAWELDLWGRVGRLVEAADADVDVAVEDYRDAAVSLLAELALAYVEVGALRQRIEVAREELALSEEALRLVTSRADEGTGSRLDVERSASELALENARLPELERGLSAAENRIAILVGERPRNGLVTARRDLTPAGDVALGVPADLLVRRADVRRAERRLAAAVARIGAAEAERYPRLSLTGTLALRARDLETLGEGADALSYSFGPILSLPLFTGNRLANEVRLGEARADEARIALERTLLEAIGEVENAAVGLARAHERAARIGRAAPPARRNAELARELYDAGLRTREQLIDARRAELAIEDELVLAQRAELVGTIDLYRALGGGFEPSAAGEEETPAE